MPEKNWYKDACERLRSIPGSPLLAGLSATRPSCVGGRESRCLAPLCQLFSKFRQFPVGIYAREKPTVKAK